MQALDRADRFFAHFGFLKILTIPEFAKGRQENIIKTNILADFLDRKRFNVFIYVGFVLCLELDSGRKII